MLKTEFVPLSELPAHLCDLPIPTYVDHERIGVNMDRLCGIATLGGFVADQVRVVSIGGDTTKESVGIAGASGDSAFGMMTGAATKASIADHDYTRTDDIYRAIPLQITLNSAEISDRVQRGRKPLREPEAWTGHVDRALRKGVHNAVWKRMVGSRPPREELRASVMVAAYAALHGGMGGFSYPLAAQAIPDMVMVLGLNGMQIANMIKFGASTREATFSMVPFFHADRAAIATGRVLTSRLVKTL